MVCALSYALSACALVLPESRLARTSAQVLQPMKRQLTAGSIPYGCSPMHHEPFVPDVKLEGTLPTVTVVVATFGGRHEFHSLLNYTFLSQEYPESKLDLLILDDNSTEDSPFASYWQQHPRVEYVRRADAHVIGWKRNWLLEHAKGDIIVQIDDDDFYNTHYVRFMVEYLQKHSDIGVKLVKMASWVNFIPARSNWKHYSGKATFESICTEFPNNGFAFAWAFSRDVGSQCQFQTVGYGEELSFMECLLDAYGSDSVHQIGDSGAQLMKVDLCNGITSMFAMLAFLPWVGTLIPDENMTSMYGQDAWSAVHDFSLSTVNMARCTGLKPKP